MKIKIDMEVFKNICSTTLFIGVIFICGMSLLILDDVCKEIEELSLQVKYLQGKLNE